MCSNSFQSEAPLVIFATTINYELQKSTLVNRVIMMVALPLKKSKIHFSNKFKQYFTQYVESSDQICQMTICQ